MNGESSKSGIICQKDIWKTCVVCGDLNKTVLMKSVNRASHLHTIVAYLKFTGSIDSTRDFTSYDQHKTYECYVCLDHIDAPAKALRKIYAFPPETTEMNRKYDPEGLVEVLKQYMPADYHQLTIQDLDDAIPDSLVPITREAQKVDCSCCNILVKTRNRLKTVIENAEETKSCIQLNFAIFEELTDTKNQLNFQIIQDVVGAEPVVNISPRQQAHERYLLGFEQQKEKAMTANILARKIASNIQYHVKPSFEVITYQPYPPVQRRQLSILPTYPGVPYPANSIQHLLKTPATKKKYKIEPDSIPSKNRLSFSDRKRKNPLSPTLTQLTTSNNMLPKRVPSYLQHLEETAMVPDSNYNFSPATYSLSSDQKQATFHCAKDILNSKCIVFSARDMNALLPDKDPKMMKEALSQLKTSGLVHSKTLAGNTVFIKEIRREYLKDLWSYGIIPEHFRQRVLGQNSAERIREQFSRHKNELIELNSNPKISELIAVILSATKNPELRIEFGKLNSDNGSFYKKRMPILQAWNVDELKTAEI